MNVRAAGLLTVFAFALFATAADAGVRAAASQEKKTSQKATASVAGRWSMAVKGSPHGDMTLALELAQDGTKLTGTLATPHGDLRVAGELGEDTLTLATLEGQETRITLKAKVKADGTLDGYLSSEMGDMTWTAQRTTGK